MKWGGTDDQPFEQVDEVVEDAITIAFSRQAEGQSTKVYCPRTPDPSFAADRISEAVPAKDALSGAVKLANQVKLSTVVVDPDGVWKKESGELKRGQDDAEAE